MHVLDFTSQTASFINFVLLHIMEKVKPNQPTDKIKQRLESGEAHFRLRTASLGPGSSSLPQGHRGPRFSLVSRAQCMCLSKGPSRSTTHPKAPGVTCRAAKTKTEKKKDKVGPCGKCYPARTCHGTRPATRPHSAAASGLSGATRGVRFQNVQAFLLVFAWFHSL